MQTTDLDLARCMAAHQGYYVSDAEKRHVAEAVAASERSSRTSRAQQDLSLVEQEQLRLVLQLSAQDQQQQQTEDGELQRAIDLSRRESAQANRFDDEERLQLAAVLAASAREAQIVAEQRAYEDDSPGMEEAPHQSVMFEPLMRRYTTAPTVRPARPLPTPPSFFQRSQSASSAGAKPVFVAPVQPEEDPFADSFEVEVEDREQEPLSLPEVAPLSQSAPVEATQLPQPTLQHRASSMLRRQQTMSPAELDARNRQMQLTEDIRGVRIGFQAVDDAL
jgi:hypothetical protein